MQNFNDPNTKEINFVSRIAGISILLGSAACYLGDAEALYPWVMASCALISFFGPFTAEKTFSTKPAHKLPCILLPGLLIMGALAY